MAREADTVPRMIPDARIAARMIPLPFSASGRPARRHRTVVTLALEKPLFRNVPGKRPVVTLRGKKF